MRLTYGEIEELADSDAYGGLRELSGSTCAFLLCALATFTENKWNWSDSADNWDDIQALVSAATNEIMQLVENGNGVEEMPIAVIADQKTLGTDGGTFTAGAMRVRDLNTELSDPENIVAVADNKFTPIAGTYLILASAPAFKTQQHQCRLWDDTASEEIEMGSAEIAATAYAAQTRSWVATVVTLDGETDIELQHECNTTYADRGMGIAGDMNVEIYALVILIKVE